MEILVRALRGRDIRAAVDTASKDEQPKQQEWHDKPTTFYLFGKEYDVQSQRFVRETKYV